MPHAARHPLNPTRWLFCVLVSLASSAAFAQPPAAQPADAYRAAWAAYCSHDLPGALARFEELLERDPADLNAFYGWALLSGGVEGGPQPLDVAERLFALPVVPEAFLDAYSQDILPVSAARRDRKRVERFCAGALAHPSLSPEAREIVEAFHQVYRYIDGDREQVAAQQGEHRPHITEWAFAGAFPNELGSGFDRTFGPLAALVPFDEEEEGVRMANDTEFGLASYVYARDVGRVWRVAEALESGMVGANTGLISTTTAPFGGVKQSGLGREGGAGGIEEFLETKSLCFGL